MANVIPGPFLPRSTVSLVPSSTRPKCTEQEKHSIPMGASFEMPLASSRRHCQWFYSTESFLICVLFDNFLIWQTKLASPIVGRFGPHLDCDTA